MGDKTQDLTQGNVWGKLIRYALPFIVISLMQSLYSMVDLIVSGYFIGSRGISGINNASQIMVFSTQIIIGLSQGGNILVGQLFGAGEEKRWKKTVNTLFYSFMILSVIALLLLFFLAGPILRVLDAPAYKEALIYLKICAFGVIFIFGYNALVAAVRGVGDSKRPMQVIIVSTVINVILDVVFMGLFQMGTAGAALATVISQAVSFVLIFWYVLRSRDVFGIWLRHPQMIGTAFRDIVKLGIPCAIQMSLAGLSWLTVTKAINGYGVDASAGSGISSKIKDFCQMFSAAIASASSTMVAQALGAEKTDRAKEVLYAAMKMTCLVSVILILVVELTAPALTGIFTGDAKTAQIAVENLRIEIIGQIFYAIFFVYHQFAIGAGHTVFVLFSSFVNCILVRLILVLVLNPILGLTGVFVACMIAPSASVPLGMLYVRSGIWKKKSKIIHKDA